MRLVDGYLAIEVDVDAIELVYSDKILENENALPVRFRPIHHKGRICTKSATLHAKCHP